MLTGYEIANQMMNGRVLIDPPPQKIGPNSADLTLSPWITTYKTGVVLDMKEPPNGLTFKMPPEGMVLVPGNLYLGSTVERAGSDFYVPGIEGRSSVARLGLQVHVSAGFGDVGFKGRWTLEMSVVHPVRIYPGVRICQVFFHTVEGHTELYDGKYTHQERLESPMESELWMDMEGA